MTDTTATSPPTLAPCAYCSCEHARHGPYGRCLDARKAFCPSGQICYGYVPEPDDSDTSEYREGFIDGYLRAHADGGEYACSIRCAKIGYEKYKVDGGRALPRQNVEGW